MRTNTRRRGHAVLSTVTLAALVGLACDGPVSPGDTRTMQPGEQQFGGVPPPPPPGGGVCPVRKFTGGGRIDPFGEKVTFGFNVHANDDCEPIKGQLQVVHHPTQTKYHSTSIRTFESYPSPEGGECGRWTGTVRVKHGNGDWHEHDFDVEACDNGEPGSSPGTGPDTFWFTVSGSGPGHGSTGRTRLTGGNIQAH